MSNKEIVRMTLRLPKKLDDALSEYAVNERLSRNAAILRLVDLTLNAVVHGDEDAIREIVRINSSSMSEAEKVNLLSESSMLRSSLDEYVYELDRIQRMLLSMTGLAHKDEDIASDVAEVIVDIEESKDIIDSFNKDLGGVIWHMVQ